jgi:hypothetical protein
MIIVTLQRAYLEMLNRQGVAAAGWILAKSGYVEALMEHPAFAGIVRDGGNAAVVAAVGLVEQNPGNFRCWCVSDDRLMSRHFLAVNHGIIKFFRESKARRIETVVQADNAAGHRWVQRILGFSNGFPMQAFNEDGTAWLYERIQG